MPHTLQRAEVPVWGEQPPNDWRFWRLVLRPHWRALGALLAAQTFSALCLVAMPYALSGVLRVIIGRYRGVELNWPSLVLDVVLFIAAALADIYATRAIASASLTIQPKLRQTALLCLLEHLEKHSHRFLVNQHSGGMASRMNLASNAVAEGLWIGLTEIWPTFVVVIAAAFLMLFISVPLTIVVLLWFTVFFATAVYMATSRYEQDMVSARSAAHARNLLADTVGNLITVKLFARERFEMHRLRDAHDDWYGKATAYALERERSRVVLQLLMTAFRIALLLLAIYLLTQPGGELAHFMLIVFLSNVIIAQARTGTGRITELQRELVNVSNCVEALLVPHDLQSDAAGQDATPLTGKIEFKSVGFSYEPGRPIFEGFNLFVPAAQKLGIVGSSGSGKSSFINLLLRLYDVSHGAVLLDGVDIRSLPLRDVAKQISVIPQDPVLFHRSILENIRYGDTDASDEEVIAAAKKAACHDFIMALPNQYAALVGERGVKLSGGQRQRIAIARAILKDAPIVVMDEATSALDSITESAIQETLQNATRDKTVIVVAHRLSTVRKLDRILVLEAGRVVEDGSHEALVQAEGIYHRLWSQQSDAERMNTAPGESP